MRERLILVAMLLLSSGCAQPPPTTDELRMLEARATELSLALEAQTTAEPDGIVVRLKFDDTVDLDLYVTDPLLETVYFARHETRTGGTIAADVRCDTTGPRVEEVRFPNPWPGRYRVGVDFPARCDDSATSAPAPYAVSVSANGVVHEAHGLVNLRYFEVVVLEFEIIESQIDHGES